MAFFEDRARLLEMSTKQPGALRYRKVAHSTGEGERYEEGCAALALLRGLRRRPAGLLLAANDAAAGRFDDLALSWGGAALLVQLKHRTAARRAALRRARLAAPAGHFSVQMYRRSYADIKSSLLGGSYALVLSTNAALDRDAESMFVAVDPRSVPGMELLDAGGRCYKLNPDDEDARLAAEGDCEFMRHFYLFCDQSNYRTINDKICEELKLLLGADGSCCRALCDDLCGRLREWMNAQDVYLTSSWEGWLDIVDTYVRKEVTSCNGIVTRIKYSSVEALQEHLQGCNPAWIRPPGDGAMVLSATKVHQIICDEKHIMVSVTRFGELEEKILCCWGPFCRWLVLVDNSEHSYDTLLRIGQLARPERRLVIVSYKGADSFPDTCTSGDIRDDTWKELIATKVNLNSEQHICRLEDLCDIAALKVMLDGRPRALLALSQLSGPVRMGQGLDPLPDNHVPRQLTSRMRVRQEFFSSLKDKEMCITDEVSYKLLANKPFLKNTIQFEKLENYLSASDFVWPLVVVTKNIDISSVQKICSKYSDIVVYVLSYTSDGWEILYLHQGTVKVQSFIEENSRCLLQIVEGWSNRVIVEGKPGIGKSTMLKELAIQLKGERASWWVVRIDLLKFSEVFATCASGVEVGEDILVRAVYNGGDLCELESSLLQMCLQSYPYIICMVDGFDEVCPDYAVKCLQALQVLAPRQGKLVVTTRPYVTGHLEAGLGVLAHSLPAFSVEQVHRFLGSPCSETEVTDVVTDLLKIPLFSSMYAELLKGGVEANDIVSLYEAFFEKKFRRLYEEKWGDNLTTAGRKKKFQRERMEHEKQLGLLAVTYLLPGLEVPIHSHVSSIDGDDLVRAGVIYEFANDKPVFIHRTFAEHFLAKWCFHYDVNGLRADVYGKAHSDNSLEFFVESFDRIASRGRALLTAALNGSVSEVESLLEKGADLREEDDMGRNSLHLAAAYSRDSTLVQLLVENLESEVLREAARSLEGGWATELEWPVGDSAPVETWRSREVLEVADLSQHVEAARAVAAALAAEDGLLRWTPLRYAAERRRWGAAAALLEVGAQPSQLVGARRVPHHSERAARFWDRVGGDSRLLDPAPEPAGSPQLAEHHYENGTCLQVAKLLEAPDMDKKSTRVTSPTSEQHQGFSGSSQMDEYRQMAPHESVIGGSTFHQLTEAGVAFFDTECGTMLHEAARRGDAELVRQLIEAGADVNAQNNDGKSAIHFAAAAGSAACIKWLHSAGCDVNTRDCKGGTALHYAAEIGRAQSVGLLLAAGADAHRRDSEGRTPLHVATGRGNAVCVRRLARAGGLRLRDPRDRTALHLAAQSGGGESLRQLLRAGARAGAFGGGAESLRELLLARANKTGWTIVGYSALHFAVANGHVDCARLLLEAGADVREKDGSGDTPLHLAARAGTAPCVRLLVEAGADAREGNCDGDTPLHLAIATAECVRRLLNAGARVTARNSRGDTPLHKAAVRGYAESVMLLLESGADVGRVNDDGDTPLHLACECFEPQCVSLLLDAGARVSAQNSRGNTPLHWAARKGRARSVELLLDAGAAIGQANGGGDTPLHSAIASGHGQCVRLLLEYGAMVCRVGNTPVSERGSVASSQCSVRGGADIRAETSEGLPPLHRAARPGSADGIGRLLADGASVAVQDSSGSTPLHYAASSGNADVVEMLVGAGADLHVQNSDGCTPLFSAVRSCSEACVGLLLRGGADLQATDRSGNTLLHCAAEIGHAETVQLLIREGAAVQASNEKLETPLHIAVKNEHSHCVQALLEASAPQGRNVCGLTPLHVAIKAKNHQIITLLLNAGADVHVQDKNSFTPFHYVVLHEKLNCRYVLELVERATTNFEVAGPAGLTSLHLAAITGCESCVQQLLECRARVGTRDDKGSTALHHAACNGNAKCLEMLLDANADVHVKDASGRTPLHRAVEHGHEACARPLLAACKRLPLERARRTPPQPAGANACRECSLLELQFTSSQYPDIFQVYSDYLPVAAGV